MGCYLSALQFKLHLLGHYRTCRPVRCQWEVTNQRKFSAHAMQLFWFVLRVTVLYWRMNYISKKSLCSNNKIPTFILFHLSSLGWENLRLHCVFLHNIPSFPYDPREGFTTRPGTLSVYLSVLPGMLSLTGNNSSASCIYNHNFLLLTWTVQWFSLE